MKMNENKGGKFINFAEIGGICIIHWLKGMDAPECFSHSIITNLHSI